MPIQLQPADYVLAAFTLAAAITGLFRGFSGTLAFFLACASAALVAPLIWHHSADWTSVVWLKGLIATAGTLLAFGIVRVVVKKLVNGMLSQPSDAIFGFVVGAMFGVALLAVWAYFGVYLDYSTLAKELSHYVR